MECFVPLLRTIVYVTIWTTISYAEQIVNFENIIWSTCLEFRIEALYFIQFSVQQCIQECALRGDCKFLGYDIRLHRCSLYFNENLYNKIEKGRTCAFIFRRHIDLQQITPVCSCNDGYVCDFNNGNCVIRECQPVKVNNGFVYGNVRKVYAMARIKCQNGYKELNAVQEITCKSDRNWSYLPSCVLMTSNSSTTTSSSQTSTTKQSIITTTDITLHVMTTTKSIGLVKTSSQTTTSEGTKTVCPSLPNEWISPSAANASFQVLIVLASLKSGESIIECAKQSSSLGKINELWKQNALSNSLANCIGYSSSCYWIDGFKSSSTWQFSDSEEMPSSNLFWDTGQPSSSSGLSCVSINTNQLWEARNCNNQCGYICER